MFDNDAVGKMMKSVTSLCTPLQDVILREALTDREYANKAAAELLALRAELTDAKARAAAAEKGWHANEARIGKLQMVSTAFLNEVPESEIELAREIFGNTNTRIMIEKRRELEAALKGAA